MTASRDPTVTYHMYTLADVSSAQTAERVLRHIASSDWPFIPDRMGHESPREKRFDLMKGIAMWTQTRSSAMLDHFGGLQLSRRKNPQMEFDVHWGFHPMDHFHGITLKVEEGFFESKESRDAFVAFCRQLAHLVPAEYGYAAHTEDWLRREEVVVAVSTNPPVRIKRYLTTFWQCLGGVFWINVFGREYADLLTKESLERLPGLELSPLPQGGWFHVLYDDPRRYSEAEVTELEAEAKQILGPDLFLDRGMFEKALRDQYRRDPSKPLPPFTYDGIRRPEFDFSPVHSKKENSD